MTSLNEISSRLLGGRLIPVVVIDDAAVAVPLARALAAGGIDVMEVTFRTAAAPDALAQLTAVDDVLVGAGTVINAGQVDQAVNAGARFVVSPGLSAAVVNRAVERAVPVLPGVSDATGIMAALELGIETVKFFPAGIAGGIAAIKALAAPFPQVRFVPTGGVGPANLAEYLGVPAVAAIGGSWMVPRDVIAAKDFPRITELAREARELVTAIDGKA